MAEGDNSNDWLWTALGGAFASNQASKGMKGASKTLGKTADQNIALSKDILGQNLAGYQPFAQFGTNALMGYQDAMNRAGQGDYSFFQNTPEYKIGEDALINSANRALAMRGNALGGGAVRDIGRLGAEYASGKYQDWRRGQREDIGLGYPAIGSMAGERTNFLTNAMQQNLIKGGAKATEQIGKGNIWAKYMEDLVKTFA
jgi:hypothetical protein